jgi:competence protein ComEC
LWLVLRLCGVRQKMQAMLMLVLVVAYCVLTGSRPPMVRATVTVGSFCVAALLGRRGNALNSLALAWLLTIVIDPADIFQTGCQISYLGVLLIFQVIVPWHRHIASSDDALHVLIASSRPLWQRVLLQAGSWLWWLLLTNVILTLAYTPLLAARYHLISPVTILVTPPLLILTSIALIIGFVFMLCAPLGDLFAAVPGTVIDWSLRAGEKCVEIGQAVPAGHWYTSGPPEWSLWLFYVPLVLLLLVPQLQRWWKAGMVGAGAWLILVLGVALVRPAETGLRCTFLAVGHGACIVLETPDGRVLLYDTGSLTGPEVTTRHIAPYLWSRGISRIDEVLLSHADLDHFNGLPALIERFRVAQVSLTPSFREKHNPGVEEAVRALQREGIPVRVLSRGDRLDAGAIEMAVLHPPGVGPEGSENARSLVLLISHAGRTLLLTGDLAEPGLADVLRLPAPRVDVLLAPHHGSRSSNTESFAAWARPGLVVSCDGRPRRALVDPYAEVGTAVFHTWQDGAVIAIMDAAGVRAETFRSGKHWSR